MEDNKKQIAVLIQKIGKNIKCQMRGIFEKQGITMPQGMVVHLLMTESEMKITDISKALGLTNSTISGIIDRLEKQDIVIRERSKEDKRIVNVRLTDKFMKEKSSFKELATEQVSKLLVEAKEEEVDKILDALKLLYEVLNRKN